MLWCQEGGPVKEVGPVREVGSSPGPRSMQSPAVVAASPRNRQLPLAPN